MAMTETPRIDAMLALLVREAAAKPRALDAIALAARAVATAAEMPDASACMAAPAPTFPPSLPGRSPALSRVAADLPRSVRGALLAVARADMTEDVRRLTARGLAVTEPVRLTGPGVRLAVELLEHDLGAALAACIAARSAADLEALRTAAQNAAAAAETLGALPRPQTSKARRRTA